MHSPSRIVITGASGFLGRHLVRVLCRRNHVIAIDRRTRSGAEEANQSSVEWYQIDLSEADAVNETFACIKAGGAVDAVIHLAAYYDFTGEENPEYQRTNVGATRLLLDACRELELGRFVFASSIAACPFSEPGHPITEATPPDGSHIYAKTKRAGEEMLAEYAGDFPSLIVRFAAMFSDWCEYPPLHVFLETWLSNRWNARVIGGRGKSAIPYLHVRDATVFMHRALERLPGLESGEILIAGEDGALSHRQLYDAATSYYFGQSRRAVHVPRPLCRPGMWMRDVVGRMMGSRPFERPWMADFVDRRMEIDSSRTHRRLGWAPNPRLGLMARLPFLIENYKASPLEWYRRNREAVEHLSLQPGFRVYRLLKKYESDIEREVVRVLTEREAATALSQSTGVSLEERIFDHRVSLRTLIGSIRVGEKESFCIYCHDLAERRTAQGFAKDEVVQALRALDNACLAVLHGDSESPHLFRAIRDSVSMTVEFGIDRVIEAYEETSVFGSDPDAG